MSRIPRCWLPGSRTLELGDGDEAQSGLHCGQAEEPVTRRHAGPTLQPQFNGVVAGVAFENWECGGAGLAGMETVLECGAAAAAAFSRWSVSDGGLDFSFIDAYLTLALSRRIIRAAGGIPGLSLPTFTSTPFDCRSQLYLMFLAHFAFFTRSQIGGAGRALTR